MELQTLVLAIIDGLLMGSAYSLVAVGLAMIWGVMEIINFAHGDFMMLGAMLTYAFFIYLGVDPLVGAVVSFVLIGVLGVLVQREIVGRILDAPLLTQVAATFALLLIIRYGTQATLGPQTWRLISGYAEPLSFGILSLPLSKIITFVISLAVLVVLHVFLKTDLGIAIRATSQDRVTAQLMGIDVSKVYAITFGLGVGIAALGGGLVALFTPIFSEMGGFFCLIAFVAVVLGGFGNVYGAYAGGIIIGVAESVSALFVDPALKTVIAFLIFIIIILLRPSGLFGR